MFYNLATKLENLREETATTENDIEFVPAHLGATKGTLKALSLLKDEWNIEILDGVSKKKVMFEDKASFTVPHDHWDTFVGLFGGKLEKGTINLRSYLAEAVNDDQTTLVKELKPELIRLYTTSPFDEVEKDLNYWRSFFGVLGYKKQSAVVSYHSKDKDIKFLHRQLLAKLQGDKGGLELLFEDILKRRALTAHPVFKNKDFLYGGRILSEYKRVKMIFECTIDFTYTISESVYFEEPQWAEVLVEESDSCTAVKNIVYPKGHRFERAFFNILKTTIKDQVE